MSAQTETEQESRSRHQNESILLANTGGRRWSNLIAASILVVTFSIAKGLVGTVIGLVTVGVWFGLGTPYALAAGVVFLTAQSSTDIASISLFLAGSGLLALLLAPVGTMNNSSIYTITVLFITGIFSSLTLILVATQPLWLTAIVLVGAGVFVMYGLYRYQQLQLGLLGDEQSEPDENGASPATSETETS